MSDNDKRETIADIIAEMRERKSQLEDAIFNAPLCYSTDDMRAKVEILDEFLDRLEAAHKRELSKNTSKNKVDFGQLGDAAKLREALQRIHDLTNALDEDCAVDPVEIRDIASAALAEPPRNCERPECATTKAAQDVWRKEDGGKTAYYDWLLATATEQEGGAK